MQITRWHILSKVFKMSIFFYLCHVPAGFQRFQESEETHEAFFFKKFLILFFFSCDIQQNIVYFSSCKNSNCEIVLGYQSCMICVKLSNLVLQRWCTTES